MSFLKKVAIYFSIINIDSGLSFPQVGRRFAINRSRAEIGEDTTSAALPQAIGTSTASVFRGKLHFILHR
jgi:hypothetical protein